MALHVDDVEVGDGGVAGRLAGLALIVVQVAPFGERVHGEHLPHTAEHC